MRSSWLPSRLPINSSIKSNMNKRNKISYYTPNWDWSNRRSTTLLRSTRKKYINSSRNCRKNHTDNKIQVPQTDLKNYQHFSEKIQKNTISYYINTKIYALLTVIWRLNCQVPMRPSETWKTIESTNRISTIRLWCNSTQISAKQCTNTP